MANFVRLAGNISSVLLKSSEFISCHGELSTLSSKQIRTRFLSQNLSPTKCWKCEIVRPNPSELFCHKCNHIQAPKDAGNYFKLFGLDPNYNLNIKALTLKYRQMQSLLHPDRFSNKSNREKKISDDYSSLVNKAYGVLQVPLKRAIHLLNLNDETIEEGLTVDDPQFLMAIMELNEEVDEASSPERLKELDEKNRKVLEDIESNLGIFFQDGNLKKAKELVIKMKYYNSVATRINSLLRERGIVD